MRRAMMEAQAQQSAQLPTKFLYKVMEIPLVRFGIDQATGIYGKVKDLNAITHKSFELAEAVTGRVVTPLASKGITLASQPLSLHKIDDMAAQGLQTLEDKVPIINKEPKAIVSDVTGAVTEKFSATKEKVNQVSDRVLVSRPVQTYFDLLEFVLSTASKTLNKVLPPGEEEAAGNLPNGTEEGRVADRGWTLLAQFFQLLHTTRSRFVKRVGLSIDRTSHAAETVFKEAKNTVNNARPLGNACENEDRSNSANGGDQQPQKKKKGNQNKGSN